MSKPRGRKSRAKLHIVRWVREQLDLTQLELARLIGASFDTIQSIEIGRLPLSERFAYAIAEQTGFKVKFLLANKMPKRSPSKEVSKEKFEHAQAGSWTGIYKAHLLPRMMFAKAYVFYRAVLDQIGYSGLVSSGGGRKLLWNLSWDLIDMLPAEQQKATYLAAREIAMDSEKTLRLLLTDVRELQRVVRATRGAKLHDTV